MRRGYAPLLVVAICLNLACSQTPRYTARGHPIYTAASITPSGGRELVALAPGRVASIYGQNLGPAQPCNGAAEPNRQLFPAELCETVVRVGGVAAGLLYVSAGQINFKVPQSAQTQGQTNIQVLYKGQAGPSVLVPLTTAEPLANSASAEQNAEKMWADLRRVKWLRQYEPKAGQCDAVPARPGFRDALNGHAYYCAQADDGVLAESFYYPVDHLNPRLLLLRADIRPVNPYPELSAEIEQLLVRRLVKTYGAAVVPEHLYEIGAMRPNPGLSWRAGQLTIFLHRNRNHVAPAGVREGVVLIAVRNEILEQRQAIHRLDETFRSFGTLPPPAIAKELEQQLPDAYFAPGPLPKSEPDRAKSEQKTRVALLRLLRQSGGDAELSAAALVAADNLTRRMASLLVIRSVANGSEHLLEAENAAKVRTQLASLGVRFGDFEHYGGDLQYDSSLLRRAWKEYPDTSWGQWAFLLLQRQSCGLPNFGCKGPNCFLAVIKQGESFLDRFPESRFRNRQIYHLALAHETWWSLGQADPEDSSAQGAGVTKASSETARLRAIELYEQLLRIAPESPEAQAALLILPRLKLKLGTGERTFFCFSC